MTYIVAYGAALLAFGVVDAIWLSIMGPLIYRPLLNEILLGSVRIVPAVLFYAVFPVGLVVFGAMPGLRSGSWTSAFGYGALFGALAYATYDLTNQATLRVWATQITVLDIAYGAFAAGLGATAAYFAARAMSPS